MTKKEVLEALLKDPELGVCFRADQEPELMTFRQFLEWFNEGTRTLYEVEADEDIEGYYVNEYSALTGRSNCRGFFDTLEDAEDMYYNFLNNRYMSDNGAGGVWYAGSEISQLPDEHFGFDLE